jgi:hypothetical protein
MQAAAESGLAAEVWDSRSPSSKIIRRQNLSHRLHPEVTYMVVFAGAKKTHY